MNDFNTKYDIYRNQIENALKDVFNDKAEDGKTIREAAMYSLSAGGKRIRPVLCLTFADILGIGMSKVLPYACAIEMIHTFSLVHDDLPGMDNDDYRRGKLTCHKVFGEAMAILAGDALLNGAYDLMLRSIDTSADMTSDLKAMRILSIATGVPGMIGGQAIDIFTSEKPMDIAALGQMYSMKTGALIKAPV
ncbi:MAG: polyprenyl synthetase family protein, partial [Saccharofermentanales bacterium]